VNTEQIKTNLQSKEVQRRIAFAQLVDKKYDLLFAAVMAIQELPRAGCAANGVIAIQREMFDIWQSMAVEQELPSER
jgi:hypothetical protein